MQSRFSRLWYRVEGLRPRLRSHVLLRRHSYRGHIWYVISDPASGRVHRFTLAAYILIGLMDGVRTVQEIWEKACVQLGDEAPSQDEVIHLLGQLHMADVLQCDVTPDSAEIFDRYSRYRRAEKLNPLLRPLSIRIPLFDPEKVLDKFSRAVKPFFSFWGLALWLAVMVTGLALAGKHWTELTADVLDQVFTPRNLILVWLVFPVVKVLHEFGHAFATKLWGGEVHEMGIMLLVFTPVPYVDVSASASFPKRRRRVMVSAAGMMIEVFLAAVALFIWLNAEPGVIRNVSYNVILIAGVSTILYNANPLIRFDGYYILSDLLEIPNLGQRSGKYAGYLAERYLFGVKDLETPSDTVRERAWFIFYAIASLAYRVVLIAGIIFFIAKKFLAAGLIMAVWTTITMLILPVVKGVNYLCNSPRLHRRRFRAVTIAGLVILLLVMIIFVVPVPLRTQAEGVMWLPERSFVRAGTDGFIQDFIVSNGTVVKRGESLVRCDNPMLSAQVRVLEAGVEELSARLRAVQQNDRVQARIIQEQLEHEQAALKRSRQRADQLLMKGDEDGTFVVLQPEDLPGRFVRQGETIGYIIPRSPATARVVVDQESIDLVRHHRTGIDARLARNIERMFPVSAVREVPAALEYLPSKVLSIEGGGKTVVDPRETTGTRTFSRTFQFDIQLPMKWTSLNVGDRVYIRFDHGWEPLVWRWYRSLRQLFLSRLDV